jgi:hypothetical protein
MSKEKKPKKDKKKKLGESYYEAIVSFKQVFFFSGLTIVLI